MGGWREGGGGDEADGARDRATMCLDQILTRAGTPSKHRGHPVPFYAEYRINS